MSQLGHVHTRAQKLRPQVVKCNVFAMIMQIHDIMTLWVGNLSAKRSGALQGRFIIPSPHTIHSARVTRHVALVPLPQAFQGHAAPWSLSGVLVSDFLDICSKLSLTLLI